MVFILRRQLITKNFGVDEIVKPAVVMAFKLAVVTTTGMKVIIENVRRISLITSFMRLAITPIIAALPICAVHVCRGISLVCISISENARGNESIIANALEKDVLFFNSKISAISFVQATV